MPNIKAKLNRNSKTQSSKAQEPRKTSKSTKSGSSQGKISRYFHTQSDSTSPECKKPKQPESVDDSFDFETPKPIKVSKIANIPKPPRAKKRQNKNDNQKPKQPRKTTKIADEDGFHLDHMQMAIALSKSCYDAEQPEAAKIEEKINNSRKSTLEEFGFKTNRLKSGAEKRKVVEPSRKTTKKSRFRFITPILFLRSEEDRKAMVAQRIASILENCGLQEDQEKDDPELDLISSLFKTYHSPESSSIIRINKLTLEELNNNAGNFYIKCLNFPHLESTCGSLLRNWREIPGRDVTPPREVKIAFEPNSSRVSSGTSTLSPFCKISETEVDENLDNDLDSARSSKILETEDNLNIPTAEEDVAVMTDETSCKEDEEIVNERNVRGITPDLFDSDDEMFPISSKNSPEKSTSSNRRNSSNECEEELSKSPKRILEDSLVVKYTQHLKKNEAMSPLHFSSTWRSKQNNSFDPTQRKENNVNHVHEQIEDYLDLTQSSNEEENTPKDSLKYTEDMESSEEMEHPSNQEGDRKITSPKEQSPDAVYLNLTQSSTEEGDTSENIKSIEESFEEKKNSSNQEHDLKIIGQNKEYLDPTQSFPDDNFLMSSQENRDCSYPKEEEEFQIKRRKSLDGNLNNNYDLADGDNNEQTIIYDPNSVPYFASLTNTTHSSSDLNVTEHVKKSLSQDNISGAVVLDLTNSNEDLSQKSVVTDEELNYSSAFDKSAKKRLRYEFSDSEEEDGRRASPIPLSPRCPQNLAPGRKMSGSPEILSNFARISSSEKCWKSPNFPETTSPVNFDLGLSHFPLPISSISSPALQNSPDSKIDKCAKMRPRYEFSDTEEEEENQSSPIPLSPQSCRGSVPDNKVSESPKFLNRSPSEERWISSEIPETTSPLNFDLGLSHFPSNSPLPSSPISSPTKTKIHENREESAFKTPLQNRRLTELKTGSTNKFKQDLLNDSFDDLMTTNVVENIEAISSNNETVTPPQRAFIIKTENVTPMLNYGEMNTPQIVQELSKFGIKPLKRRRGRQMLEYLYDATHPLVGPNFKVSDLKHMKIQVVEEDDVKNTKRRKTSVVNIEEIHKQDREIEVIGDLIDFDDLIFEKRQSKKIHSCRIPLDIVWHNFVSSNPPIRETILLYEPLQVEVIHSMLKAEGFRFDIQDLVTFLDKKCITIRTNSEGSRLKKRKS